MVKVYKALIRLLSGGTLHPPSDVCVRRDQSSSERGLGPRPAPATAGRPTRSPPPGAPGWTGPGSHSRSKDSGRLLPPGRTRTAHHCPRTWLKRSHGPSAAEKNTDNRNHSYGKPPYTNQINPCFSFSFNKTYLEKKDLIGMTLFQKKPQPTSFIRVSQQISEKNPSGASRGDGGKESF